MCVVLYNNTLVVLYNNTRPQVDWSVEVSIAIGYDHMGTAAWPTPCIVLYIKVLRRNYETITGLRCMGNCHPMAKLKYIDSVTSFPQIICYIVVLTHVANC